MRWPSPELTSLLAVAAAVLDGNGCLIEANAGFLKLLGEGEPCPIGGNVAECFIQPGFDTLMKAAPAAGGEIHRGLLTFGYRAGRTRTLVATVWRAGDEIRLLAEHNIAELERISDTVLDLNRDYAQAQLELAQALLKLQQRQVEIVSLTLTDPLTGVGNRRRLENALNQEIARTERSAGKLSALIADLDHFKSINDTFGHAGGDKVLLAFAGLLLRSTRKTDVVGRLGGEEFVVLMPDTGVEQARASAERIRQETASARIDPLSRPLTVSIGVAEFRAGETSDEFLRRVDLALYAAKHAGRNRVWVAGEDSGNVTFAGQRMTR